MSFQVSPPIDGNRETFQLYGTQPKNKAETTSLKALARKVLRGNSQGNSKETQGFHTGNSFYKVYSNILQAFLWVVTDDEEMKALRASTKVTGPIYTADEIRNLKGSNKETLKAVQAVKEIFEHSKVQQIEKKDLHL